ncbi:MAG: hypothetical protein ACTFAL_09610 [Candidatus Electronema sp. V4]|uniref:hypothetical protein n=1 Tax=Candidatus Electronema sp. V4 TaxID=3454756 RepID=UPI0040558F38
MPTSHFVSLRLTRLFDTISDIYPYFSRNRFYHDSRKKGGGSQNRSHDFRRTQPALRVSFVI